jgi:mono/diheme cytochrome c family protein
MKALIRKICSLQSVRCPHKGGADKDFSPHAPALFVWNCISLAYKCVLITLVLSACGSGSVPGKVFVPGQGHDNNWASPLFIGRSVFHGTSIKEIPAGPTGSGLFLQHCAACHGEDAKGKIGGNIQGKQVSAIVAAINTYPLMSGHSILSQTELEDIAIYLAALANNATPVSAVIKTDLCEECHAQDLSGGVSRVSCFSCHKGPRGDIGHPPGWTTAKDDPVLFHGKYGKDFAAACTACHGIDLLGGIGPGCVSCHNGNAAPILSTSREKKSVKSNKEAEGMGCLCATSSSEKTIPCIKGKNETYGGVG